MIEKRFACDERAGVVCAIIEIVSAVRHAEAPIANEPYAGAIANGASVCTTDWQDEIVSVSATKGAQGTSSDRVYR